jgi:hypothetical protein
VNDREMLEMAAKAAGLTGEVRYDYFRMTPSFMAWNPLTDDGDALRLAVKLKIDVCFYDGYAEIQAGGDGIVSASIESYSEDMYDSTRLAITRAAAEIGRAMP